MPRRCSTYAWRRFATISSGWKRFRANLRSSNA